jgi:D-3-phosphoglycerate dehydrogenase
VFILQLFIFYIKCEDEEFMGRKIIIADEMHPSIVPDLKRAGYEVDYLPEISRDELKLVIRKYDGIVIRSKTNLDKEMIDLAESLQFIARAGAGTDKIDVSYCEEKAIQILNAPEGNRDALGEHALGMLLSLLNKIHTSDYEIRQRIWDREGNRGLEIKEKTVGIIGYGNMGSAFAKRLSGFDCQVLAYDKYKKDYKDQYVIETDLDMIFRKADILSFHVPLTDETNGAYDCSFFNNFKKDIFVVNTARGPIMPLADLIVLLDEGKILGAALDVLENEKLKTLSAEQKSHFDNLINRKNVVFTPHVGGWSFESYKRINDTLLQKIISLYNSK